ncbi:replication protein [Ruegeria phage vB_RpoMi-V15]|nr:replication protein [Ruegeria phage DSS3-P22]AWY08874.1 replication protein [Ruegeria phage vB_RpoMi-V15]
MIRNAQVTPTLTGVLVKGYFGDVKYPTDGKYLPPIERACPKERAAYKIAGKAMTTGKAIKQGCHYQTTWVPFCDAPVKVFMAARGSNSPLYGSERPVEVSLLAPCRKCSKCMRVRRTRWFNRALAECKATHAQGKRTWSVTLTFDPVHLAGVLGEARGLPGHDWQARIERAAYGHVQKYYKRLRKALSCKLRYMGVAEYGEETGRLHFHVLIHEVNKPITKRTIEKLWRSNVHARLVRNPDRQAGYIVKYLTKDASSRMRASRYYGSEKKEKKQSIEHRRPPPGGSLPSIFDRNQTKVSLYERHPEIPVHTRFGLGNAPAGNGGAAVSRPPDIARECPVQGRGDFGVHLDGNAARNSDTLSRLARNPDAKASQSRDKAKKLAKIYASAGPRPYTLKSGARLLSEAHQAGLLATANKAADRAKDHRRPRLRPRQNASHSEMDAEKGSRSDRQ